MHSLKSEKKSIRPTDLGQIDLGQIDLGQIDLGQIDLDNGSRRQSSSSSSGGEMDRYLYEERTMIGFE